MKKIALLLLILVCSVNGALTMRKQQRMVNEDEVYQEISRVIKNGSRFLCENLEKNHNLEFKKNIGLKHFFKIIDITANISNREKLRNYVKIFKRLLDNYEGGCCKLGILYNRLCERIRKGRNEYNELDGYLAGDEEYDYRLAIKKFRDIRKRFNKEKKFSSGDCASMFKEQLFCYIRLVGKKYAKKIKEELSDLFLEIGKEVRREKIDNLAKEFEELKVEVRACEDMMSSKYRDRAQVDYLLSRRAYYPGCMGELSRKERGQIEKELIFNYYKNQGLEEEFDDFPDEKRFSELRVKQSDASYKLYRLGHEVYRCSYPDEESFFYHGYDYVLKEYKKDIYEFRTLYEEIVSDCPADQLYSIADQLYQFAKFFNNHLRIQERVWL